ncbi:MAG: hypothetical protein ACUVTR_07320 [Dehalococcoidia bacterium]
MREQSITLVIEIVNNRPKPGAAGAGDTVPVRFLPCPRFAKSAVLMAVELFCFVAANERLDVRLVLRHLTPAYSKATFSGRAPPQKRCARNCEPLSSLSARWRLGHFAAEPTQGCLYGTAAVPEDVSHDISVQASMMAHK